MKTAKHLKLGPKKYHSCVATGSSPRVVTELTDRALPRFRKKTHFWHWKSLNSESSISILKMSAWPRSIAHLRFEEKPIFLAAATTKRPGFWGSLVSFLPCFDWLSSSWRCCRSWSWPNLRSNLRKMKHASSEFSSSIKSGFLPGCSSLAGATPNVWSTLWTCWVTITLSSTHWSIWSSCQRWNTWRAISTYHTPSSEAQLNGLWDYKMYFLYFVLLLSSLYYLYTIYHTISQ